MASSNAAGMNGASSIDGGSSVLEVPNETPGIRNVRTFNLDDELENIGRIVKRYSNVPMGTEFPGATSDVFPDCFSRADFDYQSLRFNVNVVKVIQIGFTYMDEAGSKPPLYWTWRFNFKFDLTEDMNADYSIDLLVNSGIEFKRHEKQGIDPYEFSQLLTMSGVVVSPDVKLICFCSAYDVAYLLRLLTNGPLPEYMSEFIEVMRLYFPVVYDVKWLAQTFMYLKGDLRTMADKLELEQIGRQHQAGSDSLLNGQVFFKIREIFFEGEITYAKLCGPLVGLGIP